MSKLKPIGDRILVRRLAVETQTRGGLFLPDTAQTKVAEGHVIASGEGELRSNGLLVPNGVEVGQRVVWMPQLGTEVKIDGEEGLVMIQAYNLLGVFDDNA